MAHPLFPQTAGDSPNCFWTEVQGQQVHIQGNPTMPSEVFSALQQMVEIAIQAANRGEIVTPEKDLERKIEKASRVAGTITNVRVAIRSVERELDTFPLDTSAQLQALKDAEQALYKLVSDYHSELCKQYQNLP
jgi:N-methylhydantoinase B/oxoprolinase/acetone carboxylase alpha subunit